MDKHRQHYSTSSLPNYLGNKAHIYSTENEKKNNMNSLGATDRIPKYSAKLMCNYRTCVAFWLSELQTMDDIKNPLWLRSCLGSLEPFEAVDHKLSPLSTPPLFREMKESSDFFATDVFHGKIISPIFTAREEQTGSVSPTEKRQK